MAFLQYLTDGELMSQTKQQRKGNQRQAVVYREKHVKWCHLSEKKELSITAIKQAIKDPIAVSYFFFTGTSALIPCSLTARLSCMLLISMTQKKVRDCSQSMEILRHLSTPLLPTPPALSAGQVHNLVTKAT